MGPNNLLVASVFVLGFLCGTRHSQPRVSRDLIFSFERSL
jgi:hypothetical protein